MTRNDRDRRDHSDHRDDSDHPDTPGACGTRSARSRLLARPGAVAAAIQAHGNHTAHLCSKARTKCDGLPPACDAARPILRIGGPILRMGAPRQRPTRRSHVPHAPARHSLDGARAARPRSGHDFFRPCDTRRAERRRSQRRDRRYAAAPSGAGARVETGGTTLWYEVRGTAAGRPLVMVNGGPGFDHTYVLCSDAWDRIARGRRVVVYDQRGTARSAPLKPGQSCTLANQVDDLEALRARLGAAKIDLLGHSWGGYLVMAYAARHPEHVAHLIIADSAAPKWTDTDFIFKYVFPETVDDQAQLDFAEALGDTGAAGRSMHEYLGMLFVSSEKRDEFLSRAKTYQYTRATGTRRVS